MKKKHPKGGKDRIVKDLLATGLKGLTARKARQAVNAVFDIWKNELYIGDPVEVPGGTLQAKIRQGRSKRKIQKLKNIQTGKTMFKFAKYPGRRRVVKFTPDLNLDLSPPPAPPVPEPPEVTEIRQLATELLRLGKPADNNLLRLLQQAVDVHPHRPGALLRRLREYKARGWYFDRDVHGLACQVTASYWL